MSVAFASIIALIWFAGSVSLLRHLRNLRDLPPAEAIPDVRVSAVFAARDEAARVETTVRRLLEQYPTVTEVVAVDDRSTDGTGAILDRLAAETPRLRVVHVTELPERWLGKTHALQRGGEAATGNWILFTDADVWLEPNCVTRAATRARRDGADLVCLFPSTAPANRRSVLGDGFVLAFGMALVDVFSRVNTDEPTGFAGVGAFNLIRTDLYRRVGGHEPLRLEIADDPMLGVLVRRAGGRIRAYLAADSLECDWASGPISLLKRLEKNHFAMLRFDVRIVAAGMAVGALLWCGAVAAPWYAGPWGWAAFAGLCSFAIPAARFAMRTGASPWSALVVPFALPLLGVSLVNSTIKTLWNGGVRWRDTFYPLATLRAGCLDWRPRMRLTPPEAPSQAVA